MTNPIVEMALRHMPAVLEQLALLPGPRPRRPITKVERARRNRKAKLRRQAKRRSR